MKVRENIERPMLEKMLPSGTILKDVFSEKYKGKLTFGRQIGSYPLLIGIPGNLILNNFFDVKVIDYGFRSITAVPFPLDINTASRETIEALPGIGKKRAIRILSKRPFLNKDQFIDALDDIEISSKLLEFVSIKS